MAVTGTFPSLPGLDIAVEREEMYDTSIHKTVSGKEQRVSWSSTPIYRYVLKFNVLRRDVNAPAPNAAYDEAEVIIGFLETYKGAYGTFPFVDPFTGTTMTVRMQDNLKIKQVYNNGWEGELVLQSVK